MAARTILLCDMPHDGETPADASRTLVIGDDTREIDLCALHDKELAEKTARFMEHGRPAAATRRLVNPRQPKTSAGRAARIEEHRRQRQFLRANGKKIGDRGRFSQEHEAFLAENYPQAG